MESFIEQSELERLSKGSLEAFSDGIAAAATEKLGEEVTLFATHQDHAYGVAGDRVVKVTLERTDDGTKITVEDTDVPVITEESLDNFVGKTLSQAVQDLMGEEEGEARNRLHLLALHVEGDGKYWASDGIAMVSRLVEDQSGWHDAFKQHAEQIRGSLGEDLAKIEKSMPSTPYSKIPSASLPDFHTELFDSLQQIKERVSGIPGSVGDLQFEEGAEFEGVDLASVRDALVIEVRTVVESIEIVARLAKDKDRPAVAEYHDILAERGRAMVVLESFLSSQSTGESQDASQS